MVRTTQAGGRPRDVLSLTGRMARHAAPPGFTPRQRVAIWIRRHRVAPFLLLVPSSVLIGGLVLWPTAQLAVFSFQNYGLSQLAGSAPTQWVGFGNYSQILHDPEFWLSLRLSLVSAVIMVPLTLVVGTLVGLLLSRLGRRMATFVSSAAMLAWATPAVSASVIFVWLATPDGGIVDWFLTKVPPWLGGGAHWAGFSWTNAALPAYTLVIAVVVWAGFPFVAVSVLAGLRMIPAELHESARVDGGNSWRIFWRVTFPLLKPIFQVLFLMSIIWDFGVFTQVYIIIGELGQRDEYNLGIYEYAQAFTQPPTYGLASAAAFVLTIILLIITVGYVRSAVRQGAIQ
jgi:N,N'-diacetylchitobiose transport system permease protein